MTQTNYPIALENIVAPVELPALSETGYTLLTTDNRVTEDSETRITEEGEVRILDGFEITLYPEVHVIALEGSVYPVEVE